MEKWFENIVKNHYNSSLGFRWQEYLVFNLNFEEDMVTAEVSTGEDIHNVTVTFRQFSVHDKDRLLAIVKRSEVMLDLINGIVPDALFDCGVNIFPSSGIDLIVDCSCWSTGFLCNEAMAVLKRLEEVFKYNPFLIFSLRGFNLNNIIPFPVKDFGEIFNNTYNTSLSFILDRYLKDEIEDLLDSMNAWIDRYDFKTFSGNIELPLDIDSSYQITNNKFMNAGEFISALKSLKSPLLDCAFDLIKNHELVPEIFMTGDKHVFTRWIPSVPLDVNVLEELVVVNGKSISKTDQITVFVSLIADDLLSLISNHTSRNDVFELLTGSSVIDSERKKTLMRDISRNLSLFTIPYDYQITITDMDNEFILEFESDDDFDRLTYAYHIRKLFNYFKLYWTLNEPLKLDYNQYRKYLSRIEGHLKDLNVEVKRSFEFYEGSFRIKLTLDDSEFLSVNNLSSSSWMIDLGNCMITTEEFQKLKIDKSGIVKINGDYYNVDPVKFRSLQSDTLFLPNNFESYELLQIALLGRYRNLKFDVGEQFRELLDFQGKLPQPEGLKGKLRPYQISGYSWLVQNIKSGFGSILADDMGLGKTVQVLAAILYLKQNDLLDRQVLIVAPTTLLANWETEINKFTDLAYSIYHGDERTIKRDADVILTSYGMLRSDESKFRRKSWFLCVIDEAQNIKNPKTKQTRAVKSIKADHRIALTGTPIENRLLDYWSIFDFTNQGYLSNISRFKKEYVLPISKNPQSRVLDNLKTITKPFILRRLKTDRNIIDDLPEKNVNDIYCQLTSKQSKIYDELVKTGLSKLKDEEGIKRKGNILKLITSLKQVCNHPVQYLKKGKVNLNDSAKLELLVEIVENILDVGEKTIIFTQYVEMGKILEEVLLKKFNTEVLFLHGSLNRHKREKIIDSFQNDGSYPILVATLKTGGVGLNLTSAQNVIHYDLWWNPAVENQATDRAYRIGQKKDVMVYRFITKGTLEEKIDLTLKNKLDLADRTIESSETFITELSDDELKEMLELRL